MYKQEYTSKMVSNAILMLLTDMYKYN